MSDIAIFSDGVQKLLDTKKASGPDSIPSYVSKLCAEEIASILAVIYMQSLNSGHIPNDWLTTDVVSIFKKGDRSNPSNCRPISLASTHLLSVSSDTAVDKCLVGCQQVVINGH